MEIIALVGNPNTGKTTLFNTISKSNEHVGNWHGVTVDIKEKTLKLDNIPFVLCDLPGIYSLTNYSYEEAVTKEYLYNNDCKIINICDANNLQRNLFLTLQLLEMGKQVVLCINMKKEFLKSKKVLDIEKLKKTLKIPIFFIDADNKKEVGQVVEFALKNKIENNFCATYYKDLPIKTVNNILNKQNNLLLTNISNEFIYLKLLEQDDFVFKKLNLNNIQIKEIEKLNNNFGYEKISKVRYNYIDEICLKIIENKRCGVYGYSKLDKLLLNKYLCFPCFLLIMFLVFYLTFSGIGAMLTTGLSYLLDICFAKPLINLVSNLTSNLFIISFFEEAIISGVCSVLGFLPQVVLLFFFLNLLEDSGYMSRLAFSLEDFFSKLGLSGKSVFTLLMSFGCSTTAAMTSRNLEDKNSKIKTAILTPYLSCSAKLPIYSVICGAFFVREKTLIVFGLYILGVVVAVLVSYFLEKTFLKSGEQSFILEFPPYRIPKIKRVLKNIFVNAKQFLLRVGGIMLCFSVVIFIMQNCNFKFQFGAEDTILKTLGRFIAPIFSPLGFGTWTVAATLICGIIAKEIIVSTMGIINNVGSGSMIKLSETLLLTTSALYFTKASALSYLVFSLLYFPCMATISVLIKEIGLKWTAISLVIEFVVAYLISLAVFQIYSYALSNGILSVLISLMIFILIIVTILKAKKYILSKNKCINCTFNRNCKVKCDNKAKY